MIWSQCSWLRASTVMSRTSLPPSAFTMSIAPIDPPASPIAEVTSPSMPGSFSSSMRSVRLYDALGVTATVPCLAGVGGEFALLRDCRGNHTFEGSTLGARISPGTALVPACREDSYDQVDGRSRALPDRRQQPRLPGVLRAAGHDRDLARRADERDLRLRQHAGEDPDRVRAEGDDRRLGRRACRAASSNTSPTRPSASRAPTCCASSGRTSSRWWRRSATRTCASRATRPTT